MNRFSYLSKLINNKFCYLLLIITGLGTNLAFAPYYYFIALYPGFWLLIHKVIASDKSSKAFFYGWLFGFGYFAGGLWWIAHALLIDQQQFGWLIPFANLILPALLGMYIGLVTLITYHSKLSGLRLIVFFAISWVGVEYLRSYLFTGFAWNLVGYGLTNLIYLSQFSSIMGIYGLSFITILIIYLPYCIFKKISIAISSTILVIILIIGGWGKVRLAAKTDYHDLKIRLVQANIKQQLKWDPKAAFDNLTRHLELSSKDSKVDYIIWPESAFAYPINSIGLIDILTNIIPPKGALITGSIRIDNHKWWNSIHAINKEGQIIGVYDKIHLVPFGEYVPFRNILPIEKIVPAEADYSMAKQQKALTIDDKLPKFTALICYEIIFPNSINNYNRGEWILNVTNDGWFGNSAGPHQHLSMAIIRAIEQGIPLLRVANTGISAVVDGYGRIINKIELSTSGIIDQFLPKSLPNKTIYSQYKDNLLLIILVLLLMIIYYPKPAK